MKVLPSNQSARLTLVLLVAEKVVAPSSRLGQVLVAGKRPGTPSTNHSMSTVAGEKPEMTQRSSTPSSAPCRQELLERTWTSGGTCGPEASQAAGGEKVGGVMGSGVDLLWAHGLGGPPTSCQGSWRPGGPSMVPWVLRTSHLMPWVMEKGEELPWANGSWRTSNLVR